MSEFQRPVQSEYGFQTVFTGPIDPAERPRVEDPDLDQKGVCHELKWTLATFEVEKNRHGFPVGKSTDQRNTQRWRTSVIRQWVAAKRAEIADLERLVGRK